MNHTVQTSSAADPVHWVRRLVEQDEARAERSRAARLRLFLQDTDFSWAGGTLRLLRFAALVVALAALAFASASSGGAIAAGALPIWTGLTVAAPEAFVRSVVDAALADPNTAVIVVVGATVAGLALFLFLFQLWADLRWTFR